MGEWHRDNPELVGTAADPWSIHPGYMRALHGPDDVEVSMLAEQRREQAAETADGEET